MLRRRVVPISYGKISREGCCFFEGKSLVKIIYPAFYVNKNIRIPLSGNVKEVSGGWSAHGTAFRGLFCEATALFVMGPARGLSKVEEIPGMEAILVTASGERLFSSGLKNQLMNIPDAE